MQSRASGGAAIVQKLMIRDPKAHQLRTAMVDTTQQYSADSQLKP
jgi:hypothetical protein